MIKVSHEACERSERRALDFYFAIKSFIVYWMYLALGDLLSLHPLALLE
jgi:hypothetical protein